MVNGRLNLAAAEISLAWNNILAGMENTDYRADILKRLGSVFVDIRLEIGLQSNIPSVPTLADSNSRDTLEDSSTFGG